MELTNINAIPFVYRVQATITSINGTAQTTLILQQDSRFELLAIYGTSAPNGSFTSEDTKTNPNGFSCSIRDQTTGRDLTSARIQQRLLCGNAFNPFTQKRGIVFEPSTNLLFDFLDLSGVVNNNVELALVGYKYIV